MRPLRIAVVGAGHLGRIHARIAAGLEQIELVAVVDPVEQARLAVAAEAGTRAAADVDEVIGQIDAAIIASPTCTHHALASKLLARGIPLLVEKPLAINVAEADDLVSLSERKGATLQVGHIERFNPAWASISDAIADPKYIEATRTSGYTFRSTDIGVVMDVMIHDIDLVLAMAGALPSEVQALGISVLGGHEDMATARLTFPTGCVAQLTASRVSPQQRRTMSVFTSRLCGTIDFATHEATLIRPQDELLRRSFHVERLSTEDRGYWKEHLFDELLVTSRAETARTNAIQEEQLDFVASVRLGRKPLVDGAAGRDAVACAELILGQIAEHAWDGTPDGRKGPLAMPALPILPMPIERPGEVERRRAG